MNTIFSRGVVVLALSATLIGITVSSASAQSWHIAIEQNAMSTPCGGQNINVPGATSCPQAITVAMNLWNTYPCLRPQCPVPNSTYTVGTPTCVVDPYTVNGNQRTRYQITIPYTCVPPPAYDIKLLKAKVPGTNNYKITLMNVGSPIVAPAVITVVDNLPAGLTVTGGQGSTSTWTMIPGAGTAGPAAITLTYTFPSGTTIPTGGQIGWFTIMTSINIPQNCATATQLKVNGVVVPETTTTNNSACAQ